MGDGLKKQWGVGDPAKAGSDKQAQQFKAAFQAQISCINGHLQYTSANAEAAKHDPLAARRDALYPAFQSANGQIDPANPSKAQGAIDKVLGDAKALSTESAALKAAAEKALADWKARQPKFDAAVHQVEELEAWEDPKAGSLRALVDGIRTQTNERRYAPACTTVDALLPKLKPIFDEYLKQKEAKPKYEQMLAEQSARLDPLKAAERPSQPMTAKAGEADAAMEQARPKADAKDFVGGLEQLKGAKTAIDALDKLAKDPERAKFLAVIKEVEEQVVAPEGTVFKSQEADWSAITQAKDQAIPAGDSGDYAGANKTLADLKTKLDAFKKKHDELEKQKQEYDAALATLQPRLAEVSVSEPQYAKLQPQQQEMATVQGQMEEAATAEDFAKALELLNDLSAKVDAYVTAQTEIDKQKEEYESGLAVIQPRLTAASTSEAQYAKLQPQQQELATAQSQMEAAAQSFDYEKAVPLLQDVTTKLEAYETAKAEIDQQKEAYDSALGTLTPKIAEANKKQYPNLIAKSQEIAKGQQEMAATAQGGDYVKALEQCNALTVKVDAYIAETAKQVELPILGSAQSERADAALKKMPAADQEKVKALLDGAKSEAEKQYLLKGVASGHSVAELQEFAKKIDGKDPTWLQDNLSLTGSSTGTGVKQQWHMSCNATTVEAVKGQMDPLYALKMHEENPDLDKADDSDATKLNPKMAEDQKKMLESQGGVATPRQGGGTGIPLDDLLNEQSGDIGLKFDIQSTDGDEAMTTGLNDAQKELEKGTPVPVRVADDNGGHFVLMTGVDPGPPRRYSFHDPWEGKSLVFTDEQLKSGNFNIAGYNKMSHIYKPSAKTEP